jgi:hypothetical protein
MITVTYFGPPGGVEFLANMLEEQKLVVRYNAPRVSRVGGLEPKVVVPLLVESGGTVLGVGVIAAVTKFQERFPRGAAQVTIDGEGLTQQTG